MMDADVAASFAMVSLAVGGSMSEPVELYAFF